MAPTQASGSISYASSIHQVCERRRPGDDNGTCQGQPGWKFRLDFQDDRVNAQSFVLADGGHAMSVHTNVFILECSLQMDQSRLQVFRR